MSRLRVHNFAISLDGYGAGPAQSLQKPLGVGGMALHEWVFPTRTFQKILGKEQGTVGVNEDFAARGFDNIGAWIMGRNMFGPVRGPWPDNNWRGWWGETPPYHVPVFVLTHHERPALTLADTTFHFVTSGLEAAWQQAREAAQGRDVRLGGGVATVRAFLQAGLIHELHLAITPVVLGTGEHLLHDIDLLKLGYRCSAHVASHDATHVVLSK